MSKFFLILGLIQGFRVFSSPQQGDLGVYTRRGRGCPPNVNISSSLTNTCLLDLARRGKPGREGMFKCLPFPSQAFLLVLDHFREGREGI